MSSSAFAYAVPKETIVVTADNKTRLYTADNPRFTMSFGDSGVTIDDIDVLPDIYCEANPSSDAGVYSIVLSGGSDDKYDFEFVEGDLTVEKLMISEFELVVKDTTMVYDGYSREFRYTVRPGSDEYGRVLQIHPELVQIDVVYTTLNDSFLTPKHVGSYPVTVQVTDSNVTGAKVPYFKYMDITKAPLLVTTNDYERLYNTNNPTFELIYESLLGDDLPSSLDFIPEATCSASNDSPIGEYPIVVHVQDDPNYDITTQNSVLTVYEPNSRVTLSVQDASFVYDGVGKSALYTVVPEFGVEVLYNGSTILPVDAGVYQVTALIKDDSYVGSPVSSSGQLVIYKAPLSITAVDMYKRYLEPISSDLTMTFDGLIAGETSANLDELPKISTEVTDITPPGLYPITVVGGSDINYEYTFYDGVYTVSEEEFEVSISVNDFTVSYTGQNVSADVVVVPSDYLYDVTYNLSDNEPKNVGVYSIVATITDSRYLGGNKSSSATLVITPAPLLIKANDQERYYSQVNPVLTTNYYGLVGGDHGISEAPSVWTDAEEFSYVGEHDISIEGGSDLNYDISLEPGVMSIKHFPVTIEFQQLEFEYDGAVKEVVPITDPENIDVALYYNGSLVPPSSIGIHDVKATVIDTNYEGDTSTVMSINPKVIEFEALKLIVVDSNNSSTFQIAGIDNYSNNALKMFDRQGRLLLDQENYTNNFSMRDYPNGTYFYVFSYEISGERRYEKSFVEVVHK